ncbi:MAG TPA: hypothetical protein VMF87_28040 [Streptosporangiaceae bacterium]|nr:hypothetical protein [Streptosporangiaceae bacterium]
MPADLGDQGAGRGPVASHGSGPSQPIFGANSNGTFGRKDLFCRTSCWICRRWPLTAVGSEQDENTNRIGITLPGCAAPGTQGIADMLLLIGAYQTVCGVLNAFEIPHPNPAKPAEHPPVLPPGTDRLTRAISGHTELIALQGALMNPGQATIAGARHETAAVNGTRLHYVTAGDQGVDRRWCTWMYETRNETTPEQ